MPITWERVMVNVIRKGNPGRSEKLLTQPRQVITIAEPANFTQSDDTLYAVVHAADDYSNPARCTQCNISVPQAPSGVAARIRPNRCHNANPDSRHTYTATIDPVAMCAASSAAQRSAQSHWQLPCAGPECTAYQAREGHTEDWTFGRMVKPTRVKSVRSTLCTF